MTSIARFEQNGLAIDARVDDGQVWLTYEQTAELFGCTRENVVAHVGAILDDQELPPETCKDFLQVRTEGNRSVNRSARHLNQDMVMAAGFRIRSPMASAYRRWAILVLKGEAAPLAAPKRPPTVAELCLAQAQALVEHELRMEVTEARVEALEQHQAQALAAADDALALPPATVDVSGRTQGQMAVAAMKAWAVSHAGAFQHATRLFYGAVLERPETRIDLRARLNFAKRNKSRGSKAKRLCDIIDDSGVAAEIYAIARQLFAEKAA